MLLEYIDAFEHVRISRITQPASGQENALNPLKQTATNEWIDTIEGIDSALRLPKNFSGEIAILSKKPAELRMKTESNADSFLIVAEKFDPQWVAEIDGEKTPLYRADGILQSLRLPAGTHEVVLRYQPPRLALTVSGVSWGIQMLLLLLFGASFLKKNR